MAQGKIPRDVLEIVRMGRMTALQKANGGFRGDSGRRHCETFGHKDDCSTDPRVLWKRDNIPIPVCVVNAGWALNASRMRFRQSLMQTPRATVLSVDGISAFGHHIARGHVARFAQDGRG